MIQPLVLDIETDGLDEQRCKLLGLGWYNGVNRRQEFLTEPAQIQRFFKERPDGNFIYHHGSFDIKVLARTLGYLPSATWWFDTRLAAAVLPNRPSKLTLESCAAKYSNSLPWKEGEFLATTGAQSIQDVSAYCLKDCQETWDLAAHLVSRLSNLGIMDWYNRFFMPLARLCVQAEYNGCHVDRMGIDKILEVTKESVEEQTTFLSTEYRAFIDEYLTVKKSWKWSSTDAVKWLLNQKLGIPLIGLDKKVGTGKDVLEIYRDTHPIVEQILKLRQDVAMVGHYKKWLELSAGDGKIYTHYNLDIARTGRLSSSNPINLQNVKRGAPRKLFIPAPGFRFTILDYAQVEPRVLAHLSNDPILVGYFESGQDFYSALAKETLGLEGTPNEIKVKYPEIRQLFKTIGLSIIYGIGPAKLARYLTRGLGKKYSYSEALAVREGLLKRLQGVKDYRAYLMEFHSKHGYIENLLGRRLYMPEQDLYHKGINTIVQSSASDLCCEGQIRLDKALTAAGIYHKLTLLVHDEAVNEVRPEDEAKVKELALEACQSFNLRVPTPIELFFGDSWGAKG